MQSIQLFLFHIQDTDLFAFSDELAGKNLPMPIEGQEWTFLEEIKHIKVEEYVDPPEFHQAVSAVLEHGYFIFHAEMMPFTGASECPSTPVPRFG